MSNLSTYIFVTPSNVTESACLCCNKDIDVKVEIGGCILTGNVTLRANSNGDWATLGDVEHWIDAELIESVRLECKRRGMRVKRVFDIIANAAAKACD